MHHFSARVFAAVLLLNTPPPRPTFVPSVRERVATNDNRSPAGVLRNGVLTVRLEVREAEWHPDGEADPGVVIRAFAEEGGPPLVPGPLLRVPEGTVIEASVRNTLPSGSLVVRGMSPRGVANAGADTLQVRPGATRTIRFLAGAAGTYHYSATVDGASVEDRSARNALLNGAFIVDAPDARRVASDRVLVLSLWNPRPAPNGQIGRRDLLRFAINGKAWPHTERLSYAAGDTVRLRVVNTSAAVHPMHLHGFYFRVESRGDGMIDSVYDRAAPPHLVVTERAVTGQTFTMSWVPKRTGNWLLHCHDNYHTLRNPPLDGSPLSAEQTQHVGNHTMEMMGGLMMGVEVRGRDASDVQSAGARRRLRLVAAVDTGGNDMEPAYAYALTEASSLVSMPKLPRLPGPTIVLKRGEPVSITVVNALPEPTAVHWHGIELESYYDGVPGFSGSTKRPSPAIAPRDSFVAHFTPPRSGTFIYHPHADEVRQQQAGLSGAIVVVDEPTAFHPATDVVLLITVPRREADGASVLLNGSVMPPPFDMRVGVRYRLRIVDIHTYRPSMIAQLVRNSEPVKWRALAKDGMELPSDRATMRPSVQQMGNGETYDFEFIPTVAGDLRFVVASAGGASLASMVIRVR